MEAETRNIDNVIDAFCRKVAHIVVESRLGKKIKTPCRERADPADWFNLSTGDVPEVVDEVQRLLKSCGGVRRSLSPSARSATAGDDDQAAATESAANRTVTFCVEISLCTGDGVLLVLEYWRLVLTAPSGAATSASVSQSASHLGLLLKSLLVTTRLTSGYKLSRQQSQESHVILYKMFLGEPDLAALGDNSERLVIGEVATLLCHVSLVLAYRTRLTVSERADTMTAAATEMVIKSDHFRPEVSPRARRITGFAEQRYSDSIDMAVVSSSSSSNMETKTTGGSSTDSEQKRRVGAFAGDATFPVGDRPATSVSLAPDDDPVDDSQVPFSRLLSMASSVMPTAAAGSCGDVSMSDSQQAAAVLTDERHTESSPLSSQTAGLTDDFVMKPPFSDADSVDLELGYFFRRTPQSGGPQSPASPAPSVSSGGGSDERGVSVSQQLRSYQIKSQEYDDLIAQLSQTGLDGRTMDAS